MKLVGRQPVEGTENPVIYIGHREIRHKATGKLRTARPYSAEYTLAAHQKVVTLKTTNKNVAIQAAHELHRRVVNGETLTRPSAVRFDSLVHGYLAMHRAKGSSPKTIAKYVHDLDEFVNWCKARRLSLARSFAADDLHEYGSMLRERGRAQKTIYTKLTIVKQMFRWAARGARITTNPVAIISLNKPESAQQPCFTPEQVCQLLDDASANLRPIFATLAYTGMRIGELRELRWSDVDFNAVGHGCITISRGGSNGTTKSRKRRRIPIHPELRQVLDSMPRLDERVFLAPRSIRYPKARPISDRRLLIALKRLCRDCGFRNPNQYKIHTFRHSFASMLARRQVSHRYALEFMGHSSSKILDIYFTMHDDAACDAIATIVYEAPATNQKKVENSSDQ